MKLTQLSRTVSSLANMANPPLHGIKVLEFAGLAPGPFAGLMLADAGASVLRIDRPSPPSHPTLPADPLARRKVSIAVDLKDPQGAALVRRLARHVDILIEPFRPGVLERLGLGPDTLLAANPRLLYGRITGFRRSGRYAAMAGHDINYLAVSGVLGMLGPAGAPPSPPVNLLADFAGGGANLVHGLLLALVARGASGRGQLVEANMVDGSAYLATFARAAPGVAEGAVPGRGRGRNLLDGGAPFYATYETSDGGYVAVGALEPQFFRALLRGLGLAGQGWEEKREEPRNWPALRGVLAAAFRARTRAEWEAVFDGTDACCTPVLGWGELRDQPGREGDQRAPVALAGTPCYAACEGEGAGYEGVYLRAGEGGEGLLAEWAGWRRGVDYDVGEDGALGMKSDAVAKL